jgi:hypothetical protein
MTMTKHRFQDRPELKGIIERALISGTAASLLSTAALAALARLEGKGVAQPTNSTSHVYWGNEAAAVTDPDLRHSVPGYFVHHASAVFWAMLFETITGDDCSTPKLARNAAAVMATAGLLDYGLLPERLTPGFERVLSTRSTILAFAGLAAGLVIGRMLAQRTSHGRSGADATRLKFKGG